MVGCRAHPIRIDEISKSFLESMIEFVLLIELGAAIPGVNMKPKPFCRRLLPIFHDDKKKKKKKKQKPVMGFQKRFKGKTLCPTKKQRQRVAVATPDWALASRLSVETNGRNSMIATLLRRDDK